LTGVAGMLITGLVFAAAGCGGSDDAGSPTSTGVAGGLSVTVEPAEAAPGDEIAARVVNDTDQAYTYGAAYELERHAGGGWEQVKLPDRPIIEIGYVAEAGETGPPVSVAVPKDAAAGRWRVVIDRDAAAAGLLAGEFEVVGG